MVLDGKVKSLGPGKPVTTGAVVVAEAEEVVEVVLKYAAWTAETKAPANRICLVNIVKN